jgi:(E)-4-hydroxy-3-methylbut-2-enyl-diphosphate synthase
MKKYCPHLNKYQRWKTREVKVGSLGFGGSNPIRIQSMTTTDTMDTEASLAQSKRMIDAGCELVRLTAPSKKDAANLKNIKEQLIANGYDAPLVADIHFTPNAASEAAKHVEKVRVNPGNYADKKKFEEIEYTDESYQAELDRIRDKFTPLVLECKELGRAMRIGTNHGSLSDRILSRYGDTPLGMVESAMEFINICRDNNYHDLIISMKASNPKVMVQAYRLLVATMMEKGMNYPLHLGVTEAGDGEDGRIKSAVGIGTLLEDGLGDTIRVSLTEEPEEEIPVAKMLADRYNNRPSDEGIPAIEELQYSPFEYKKKDSTEVLNIGHKNVPVVLATLEEIEEIKPAHFFPFGYNYSVPLDKWNISDTAADYVYIGSNSIDFEIPGTLGIIQDYNSWDDSKDRHYPLHTGLHYLAADKKHPELNFVQVQSEHIRKDFLEKLDNTVVLILKTNKEHGYADQRFAINELLRLAYRFPVVCFRSYQEGNNDRFQLYSGTDFGALLLDGLIEGVMISAKNIPAKKVHETAFGILQATRTRISKTEYISCPSCGRTLFDLQETTAKIRKVTNHLKGVKIGIMGCIVNGPGEMADADYGYVGTGPGKITLYKEKTVVKKNVPEENAVNELIELIKEHGDWVEEKL